MEIMQDYDVIIVGGGPAGLTAGLYCKRAVLNTVLFERGLVGGQIAISKEVENYPGVEGITGFDLAEKMVHHARTYGLNIIQQEVAEVIAGADHHSVRLASGDILRSRTWSLPQEAQCGSSAFRVKLNMQEAVFHTAPHATGSSSGTSARLLSEGVTLLLKRPFICRDWQRRSVSFTGKMNCGQAGCFKTGCRRHRLK